MTAEGGSSPLNNGVLLLEEPYAGSASNFRLNRLIEWAGFKRADFTIASASREDDRWVNLARASSVVVPMGNVPTLAVLGREGILSMRGYVWPGNGYHVIPTIPAGYIQRGQSKWSAPFINDLQKAVELAQHGFPPQFTEYVLDPPPGEAYRWAQQYANALVDDPAIYLAFDIETPGKPEDEDEADTDSDAPDRTWNIERIGFSYRPLGALSIPWAPEYSAAIRLLLGGTGSKVVWNAGFDCPRIRRAGVPIGGVIHDGMVAWHILHTDLPKRLGFVATFTCPWQPAWKHLSGARPAFYNATDADVELRSMIVIEAELRRTGLWDVYQRDVLDLEPILLHMHEKGMPVDGQVRLDRAITLDQELRKTRDAMEAAVPLAARRIAHVYKKPPSNLDGLSVRPGTRLVKRCSVCALESPGKSHFKRFVKKTNPCSDGEVRVSEEAAQEYYRLAEFTPSRTQLIEYHRVMRRPLPTVFDKRTMSRKVSFGERQLKDLTARYKDDKLYSLILKYREIDKIAGTYIGRPSE